MKFYILTLLLLSVSILNCFGQNGYGDSIEKSVLQSVQSQLKNYDHYSKDYLDSIKIPAAAPFDVKSFLNDIDKQIAVAKSSGDISTLRKSYYKLSTIDSAKGNYKSAYENFKLYALYQDSLRKKEAEKKELQAHMQREFDKKQAQQQLEKEKDDRKKSIEMIFLFAFLLVFITVSTSSFIAYKREQKSKKLVNAQKGELEITLSELKSTQAQLIQSEKMASLGELTAGIAHEIQNPLNFVNNFSEVNIDLSNDLNNENDVTEIREIANDIKQNSEKILFHGKRADAIVKGMLQHSRKSEGKKEATDINALCDEDLRLSYHGLRAKDKSFNADFKTDFDESIGKINIVPQDISGVLLNLYNNAFYAVNEKQKTESLKRKAEYKPLVLVQTKKLNDTIEIKVSDNGNGIPQNIIDKIFQPFFTTKPTGQGTGLGLSLSYDIIKAHGGEIKVETKEGMGSSFIIQLS